MNQQNYCIKCNQEVITALLHTFTTLQSSSETDYCFFWGSQQDVDEATARQKSVIVNHFKNSQEVTKTHYLVQNIRQLSGRFTFDQSFLPLTLLLPHEKYELLQHLKTIPPGEYFFLRPCSYMSGSTAYKVRSIHDYKIFQELHKNHLFQAVKMPTEPLVFNGFAVYFYIHILVTSFERLKIFRYDNPLAILVSQNDQQQNDGKRSKSPFGFNSISSQMVGSGTGAVESKQELVCVPFDEFLQMLDFEVVKSSQKHQQKQLYGQKFQIFQSKKEFRGTLLNTMTDAAIIVMKSAQKQIRPSRDRQFEIFELKFQLGTDFTPYLLGVSSSPQIGVLGGRTFQTELFKNAIQHSFQQFGLEKTEGEDDQQQTENVMEKLKFASNLPIRNGFQLVCLEERGVSFMQWLTKQKTKP